MAYSGRQPTGAPAAQVGRRLVLNRRRAQYFRLSNFNQRRTFGVAKGIWSNFNFSHLIGLAPIHSNHEKCLLGAGRRRKSRSGNVDTLPNPSAQCKTL